MLRFLGQRFSLELCASVVKNRAKKQNGKPEGLPSKNQKTPKTGHTKLSLIIL